MVNSPANSLNINSAGLVKFDGTATFSAVTLTQHGVLIGGASNAITSSGVGTTGQVLQGNTGADPTYSTATYPATTTANQLLVSTATNVVGGLTAGTTGTVLTGVTGAVPAFSATPSITSITLSSGTALSAYDEGTFTPAVAFGGASTGVTYTTRIGLYTRIGRIVNIIVIIQLSNKGSSTGDITITGLPFTSNSTASFQQHIPSIAETITFGAGTAFVTYGYINPSVTTINLAAYTGNPNSTVANIGNANTANTSAFLINGSYFT